MSDIQLFETRPAAVLLFSGEDHLDFLHSQGTADLRGPVGLCRYCLWLDHKGLIHADAFVLRLEEDKALLVSYDVPADVLHARFARNIIADDVTIEDRTADWRLLSVPAASVPSFLAGRSRQPVADRFFREADGYVFAGRRLGRDSLEYLVDDRLSLPFEWVPLSPEEAEIQRIAAGVPAIPRDISPGSFNPVEAGLEQAVSFTKGCYLGQEVVARVHRLQRFSRRLVRVCAAGAWMPQDLPIDLLIDGTPAGQLTSVVGKEDEWMGIGWLKSRFEDGSHRIHGLACPGDEGLPLKVVSLTCISR